MATLTVTGNITAQELSEILQQHFSSRHIWIDNDGTGALTSGYPENTNADSIVVGFLPQSVPNEAEDIEELHDLLNWKNKEIMDLQDSTAKALESSQTFQRQHQALYDRFVSLRQMFDEQKLSLLNTLWIHCGAYHPDLREIPVLEDMARFIENEDRVGEFSVGETLGQGQFATVRSCCRDGCEKELAVKIIKKDRFTTFTALKRISNEIKILRRLRSDFIVSVKDVVQTMDNLYIITEKGGRDLFESFDDNPDGVPESWAKEVIVCVLKAVLYCHEQGICHRDIKPENILLTFDRDRGKCINLKLCDFGLSTKFNASSVLTDFCGSPGFFAPEMIITGRYSGDKVDVWSTGCVLLELLFGHRRFIDVWMIAYDYEVLQRQDLFTEEILDTVNRLPSALTFSPELNDFIMQFLILNPEDRPKCRTICTHPWLAGAFDALLVPRGTSHSHNQYHQNNCDGFHRGVSRSGMTTSHQSYTNMCNNNNNSSSSSGNSNNNSSRMGVFGSVPVLGQSSDMHRTQPGTPTRQHSPQSASGSGSSKPQSLRSLGSFSESHYAPKYTLPSLNIAPPKESTAPLSPLLYVDRDASARTEKSPNASPRAMTVSHSQLLLSTKGLSGLDSNEKVLLENYIRSRSGSFIGSQIPTRRNTIGDVIPAVDMSPWQRSQGGGSDKISLSMSQSQDNLCLFNTTEPRSSSPESRTSVQLPPISSDYNGSSSFTTISNEKYVTHDDATNEYSTVSSSSFNTMAVASPTNDRSAQSSVLALKLENALEGYDWSHLQQFNREPAVGDRPDRTQGTANTPLQRREYGSGPPTCAGAGVSFYGYGNRNYSAPRGSFVTESTGPRGSFAFDQSSTFRMSMADDGPSPRHTSFAMDSSPHTKGPFALDISEKHLKKGANDEASYRGGKMDKDPHSVGSKLNN